VRQGERLHLINEIKKGREQGSTLKRNTKRTFEGAKEEKNGKVQKKINLLCS
jgi:hypothetical protein